MICLLLQINEGQNPTQTVVGGYYALATGPLIRDSKEDDRMTALLGHQHLVNTLNIQISSDIRNIVLFLLIFVALYLSLLGGVVSQRGCRA